MKGQRSIFKQEPREKAKTDDKPVPVSFEEYAEIHETDLPQTEMELMF